MLSKERLVENFINMVKVDSPSNGEANMAKWLVQYLKDRNIEVMVDEANKFSGGNCGNIIAHIKGDSNEKPICFAAHMDQVAPCLGVKPVIDNNIIKSDGTTTLGADDKAGIAGILEALEEIIENKIPHREIYLLFTVCEEAGMMGAKGFNPENLPCKDVVILDAGGSIGVIAYKAPAQENIKVTFYGKKAHAGIEPEKGINAIVVASKAISNMHIGRIDEVTTSNIGKIEGGGATNIVTDEVCFTAEIRSHVNERLIEEIEHMKTCCEEAAKSMNATCQFENENAYPSFELSKDSYIFKLTEGATKKAGVEPIPMIIGGGSDANIMANLGYQSAIISIGMYNVHTVNEYLNIDELFAASKIVYNMMAL